MGGSRSPTRSGARTTRRRIGTGRARSRRSTPGAQAGKHDALESDQGSNAHTGGRSGALVHLAWASERTGGTLIREGRDAAAVLRTALGGKAVFPRACSFGKTGQNPMDPRGSGQVRHKAS